MSDSDQKGDMGANHPQPGALVVEHFRRGGLWDAYPTVTRITVVDDNRGGIVTERWGIQLQFALQDDGRTLRVFIRDRDRDSSGTTGPTLPDGRSATFHTEVVPVGDNTLIIGVRDGYTMIADDSAVTDTDGANHE